MTIHWRALVAGFTTACALNALILFAVASDTEFLRAPSLARPEHAIYLALLTLATGIGGYVAGRMARADYLIHGLLVGILGVFYAQLHLISGGSAPPRMFVVASALACVIGALGGLVARLQEPH